tara:strand:- start:141 stop:551 length:411 start_codon:yes stop_codon:yes gene_type:complete
MQQNTVAAKDTFAVKISVVPFVIGKNPKVALIKNEQGDYLIPEEKLMSGETCFQVADRIVNTCCALDKTDVFSINLSSCLTSKDTINLIFCLHCKQNTELNEELLLFTPKEVSELYFENKFFEKSGEVVISAIENG